MMKVKETGTKDYYSLSTGFITFEIEKGFAAVAYLY